MSAADVDWDHISATLSYEEDESSKARRQDLWRQSDVNGNGYLSLAELDKAVRDVLQLDEVFKCKKAIMRAFQEAKTSCPSKSSRGDDYIEKPEFKYFLYCLRLNFEFWHIFMKADAGEDQRIDLEEFVAAAPQLEQFVGPIANPEDEFNSMDVNGGGQILFDEFLEWAYARKGEIDVSNE